MRVEHHLTQTNTNKTCNNRLTASRWLLFSVYWTILLLYHGENKLHFSDVIMMSTLFYINSWFFYNADTTIHWWTYCSTRTCCPDSKSVNLWLHGLFVFVCVKWCSTRIVLCNKVDIIITSLKCNLFSPWYSSKMVQ
jgi:hypothetical protein